MSIVESLNARLSEALDSRDKWSRMWVEAEREKMVLMQRIMELEKGKEHTR